MAIAKYRISLKGTDSKLVRAWSLVSGEPSSISPHAQPGACTRARTAAAEQACTSRALSAGTASGWSVYLSLYFTVCSDAG